jgi:hypothetical protein
MTKWALGEALTDRLALWCSERLAHRIGAGTPARARLRHLSRAPEALASGIRACIERDLAHRPNLTEVATTLAPLAGRRRADAESAEGDDDTAATACLGGGRGVG